MRRERLRVIMLVLLVVLSSAIMLWLPLFSLSRASIVTPLFFMLIPLSFLFISKFKKIRKKLRLKRKFSMLLSLTIVLLVTVSIARLFSGTMFQAKPVHAWWDNNWDYCRKITIDSSKVDEALTDFPVLVYLNSSRIDWTNVQDDLHDLRFVADDNSTVLEYEIENYTVNNEAWLWVKTPSVSNISDTSFYMFYGNNTCGGGEDAQNVWDSNFVLVQHLNETATGTRYDSTSNNNDGATSGYDGDEAVTGKIDGADDFDGTNDYIDCGNDTSLDITGEIMVEVWIKPSANMSNNAVVAKQNGTNSQIQCALIIYDNGKTRFQVYDTSYHMAISSSSLSLNNWHHIVGVYDKQNVTVYVDTVETEGDAFTGSIQSTEAIVSIGDYYTYDGTYAFNGTIDEVRISNTSRSAGWIKASYYSGMDTLLTFGPEELGNAAPTIGEFEAPATVYANKYFFLNATIDDQDGVADFVNATVEIGYSVILKWDNATDTFSEQSDTSNYCTLDAGNSVRISVNSTAHKLSWKIKLTWNYTEGTVDLVATNTKVYDDWADSGSGSYSSLFTFEDDLIIHTDANVDDNRVNPSDTVTFTGTIYYEGTATVPEDVTGITAYVELSGTQKGSDTNVTSGRYSITFNTESSVGSYSYNIYATTDQNTVTNQTVSVTVDRIIVSYKAVNNSRLSINDNVEVQFKLRSEHDGTAVQSGAVSINGSSATWDAIHSWWKLTDSQSSVNNYTYYVSAVNWDTEEITALNSEVATNVTWAVFDRLQVQSYNVDDSRVNVDTNVDINVTIWFDYDDTVCTTAAITINGYSAMHQENGIYRITRTSASVTSETYNNVACSAETTYGITVVDQNGQSATVIWDRLIVSYKGNDDNRRDYGTAGQVRFKIRSEYDGAFVTSGSVSINGTSATWDSTNSRWYISTGTVNSVEKRTYVVTAVNWDTHDITALNSDVATNATEIIWDRLKIVLKGATDSRVDVDASSYVYFNVTREYDSVLFDDSKGTVYINGSSATWDSTNKYWKLSVSQSSVGRWTYQVSSISDTEFGITVINDAVGSQEVIWDRVCSETAMTSTNNYVNYNSENCWYTTLKLEYDGTAITSGTITLNTGTMTYSNSRWECNYTKNAVGAESRNIASVSGITYDITALNSNATVSASCTYDRIDVVTYSSVDERIDINTEGCYFFTLKYESDSSAVDDGTATLNGSLSLTYVSARSRWEYNTTRSTVQSLVVYLFSVAGNTRGITVLNSGVSSKTVEIIWDRLVVTVSADSNAPTVGTQVNFTITAVYDYESTQVTAWTVNIYRNSTHFASGNFSDTQYSEVIYQYTTENVTETTHGLTAFTSNIETVSWGGLQIEIYEITIDDARIDVNTNAYIYFHCRFNVNGSDCTTGTLAVNGTNYNINGTGWATVTVSFATVGKRIYTVTGVNVNGETDFNQTPSNPEVIWDRAIVYWTQVNDSRVDVNTAIEVRYKAVLDWDDHVIGSGGTLQINGSSASWDAGNSWWERSITQASVGNWSFIVTSVSEVTYGITSFTTNCTNLSGVWDNIVVSGKGVTDDRTNVNEYEQFWFTLRSEYDSIAVQAGTVTLNGSLSATWAASNSRWEYNTTKSSAQKLSFYVDSVVWGTYGITSLSSQASNYTSIIWDRVLVTISVNSTNPAAGQTVSFTVTAVYDFDDVSVTSWTVNIYRNSTHFATGNFTDQSDSEVKYLYTTENMTDNMYDLTAFTSNTVTVVWANLFIEVNEINVQDGRINIGTQATVYYHCRFSSNQSSCTTGTLYVNGTSFTINSTGWATVTFTFSEVCKKALVVTAINVNGETDFQQVPSNPEIIWDRVNVTISADGTYVVLNAQVNFTVTAIYEFDSNPVTSWTVNIYRNSTHFATGNFTDTQASPSVYEYTTENITETTFGLTSFQSNTVTVEWYNSPPVASFTYSPEFPIASETVTFNASTSYDLDGTIDVYKWDFGDGTAIEASPTPTMTHIYEMRGNYTVTLTVIDDEGSENKTEATITVIDYPTADFNYSPTYPLAGETVTFNASTSAPNGGTIVSYFWNFGDGTTANVTSAIITHTYSSFGNYTVTLTVKDSEGLTNSCSKVICIIDYPTADFTYSPTYPIAGEAVNFDASTSTPNGGTVISYFWDFGDGTNSTGLIVSHVYHALGSFSVTLKISDSEGLSDNTSKLIDVRQRPTANFTYSPTLPMIGETVTFNASSSTPNGGSIVTYAWNFGDAQTGTGVIANHTYLTYGTYNVTLTVTDSEGLSDSLTQTIRILIWPTANFTHSPKYPVINQTVEFDGSLSHDPDGAIFEYTWDFGDGNVTTVQNPLIKHAYQETDTYLVTLTVKDSDGLSNSITKQVIVYSVLPPPDIAVLNVQTAYSQVYQGYTLIIKVTVFNEGYSTETFNVTAYANNNIIETLTVSNLPPDEQMILTFRWDTNGFAEYQNYTISAYAHPVPIEIDTEDNTFVDGVVWLVHIGDVNNDGQVRVDDILAIALAFGSNVGDSRYDPNLDITCDGKIRIDDVLAAVLNFGWTRP